MMWEQVLHIHVIFVFGIYINDISFELRTNSKISPSAIIRAVHPLSSSAAKKASDDTVGLLFPIFCSFR
ncbi:hypothetical protein TNCV_4024741 [Trichonephila clavipes]|uniref:Uncharacterized protein n=1 Tax=Trichonephila clavipes TaxID=2585209 RepID=A0A8X7BIU5_TRICX|nr:hypothetical protein TNCV_4024741 [Trichonephila clavipes]